MTPLDPNDTEGRLRDATTAYSDTVEPAPDAWMLLRERVDEGHRRQRSRTIGAAVVGAVVAAAVVALMFLAGGSDGDLVVETPPASEGRTTPTEPGSPTTAPTSASPVAGADVVYATTDGQVLARTASGDVEVVSEPELDELVVDSLQVAPDGTLWRLTKRAGEYCGIVDRIGSDGPASRRSFGAAHFAISPDGTELAYSTAGSGAGDGLACDYEGAADAPEAVPGSRVTVMDLTTGFERTVLTHDVDAEGYPLLPGRLAWSLDGSRLAVERCWEDCDVVVVDPESEGRLAEPDGNVGTAPAWLADGRLYLADGPFNRGGPEATGPSVVKAIDLDTGDEETIADAGELPIQGLWNDPAGERLLLLIDGTLTMRGGPTPGQVDVDVLAATFGLGGTTDQGSGADGCSATPIAVAEPTLPQPVVATFEAIRAAAGVCDWEALRALMADDFSYSFGFEPSADAAISYWQDAEAAGEPIMRTLVETLAYPATELDGHYQLGDPDQPLGYRAVIREDGVWTAFVAGD
jgi:hypothetical protein